MKINPTMSIESIGVIKQATDQASQSVMDKLNVGQTVTAIVADVLDDLVMLDVDGQMVRAKLDGDQALSAGQTVRLTVTNRSANTLFVTAEQAQSTDTEALSTQLKQELLQLDIPPTDRHVAILKAVHQQQLPVDKETFIHLRDAMIGFKQIATELAANPQSAAVDWTASLRQNGLHLSAELPVETPALSVEQQTEQLKPADVSKQPTTAASQSVAVGERVAPPPTEMAVKAAQPMPPQAADVAVKSVPLNAPHIDVLSERLAASIVHLSKQPDASLMQTLGFMEGAAIAKTPLNTLIVNQWMTGQFDVLSSVVDILSERPDQLPTELRSALAELSQALIDFGDMAEQLSGERLKNLVDLGANLRRELAAHTVKSERGDKAELFAVAKHSQQLITQSAINWQALAIPVSVQQELRDIEIYVRSDDAKKGKINPDDGLIYIALTTEHLATIRVKLDFSKQALNVQFITQSEAVSDFIASNEPELVDVLKQLVDKNINVMYSANDQTVNMAELTKLPDVAIEGFDLRV